MAKHKFKIGDRVRVVQSPPFHLPKGVRDKIGTKKLLKYMVGRIYTVRGFDDHGHIELRPKRLNSVWIEPEFLRLGAPNGRNRRAKQKR